MEATPAAATLGTWEMGSPVKTLMNAVMPIQCTTVTLMLTVPTLLEALCAHVVWDTLGMASAAVSSNVALQSMLLDVNPIDFCTTYTVPVGCLRSDLTKVL